MPALQNFTDKVTKVTSAWLNQVDVLLTTIFGQAVNPSQARTALFSDAPLELSNGGTGQRSFAPSLLIGTDSHGNFITVSVPTFVPYPITPAETAGKSFNGGCNPINLQYPPGHVDRYLTNTTSGTTPMASAFQQSINQGRAGGVDIVWGETAPYALEAPLDCTNCNGLTFRQITQRATNPPPPQGSVENGALWVKHFGYTVFDLAGCAFSNFYDMSLTTQAPPGPGLGAPTPNLYPKTCFFLSRSTFGNGALPRFHNTSVQGYFSICVMYNYASEVGVYSDNDWQNIAADAGACVVVLTASNYFKGTQPGLTSSFATIVASPPPQSCISHEFRGGSYIMLNASATSDVFYIEGGGVKCRLLEFWLALSNAGGTINGRSFVYNDTVNGGANFTEMHGLQMENSVTQPQFGVDISSTTGTPLTGAAVNSWSIVDSYFNTITHDVQVDAGILVSGWRVQNLTNQTGAPGINVAGSMQSSWLDYIGNITVGNSQSNVYRNFVSNITRTVHFFDTIFDHAGVLYLDASLIVNGGTVAPGQLQGWGSPVGGGAVLNYNAATAPPAQTNQAVAAIIAYLKQTGYFGA